MIINFMAFASICGGQAICEKKAAGFYDQTTINKFGAGVKEAISKGFNLQFRQFRFARFGLN